MTFFSLIFWCGFQLFANICWLMGRVLQVLSFSSWTVRRDWMRLTLTLDFGLLAIFWWPPSPWRPESPRSWCHQTLTCIFCPVFCLFRNFQRSFMTSLYRGLCCLYRGLCCPSKDGGATRDDFRFDRETFPSLDRQRRGVSLRNLVAAIPTNKITSLFTLEEYAGHVLVLTHPCAVGFSDGMATAVSALLGAMFVVISLVFWLTRGASWGAAAVLPDAPTLGLTLNLDRRNILTWKHKGNHYEPSQMSQLWESMAK